MPRDERREELLQAALAIIRRDGASASMDAMAAEAGITKPILYRHFGSRDGLIAAVATRHADELVASLLAALGPGGAAAADPRLRIEWSVRAYVAFIEADPALYGFLSQGANVASVVGSGIFERVAAALESAISEAITAAGLPARWSETWAYGVVGMMHLAGARWASTPGQDREALVSALVNLVSNGLLGGTWPVSAGSQDTAGTP